MDESCHRYEWDINESLSRIWMSVRMRHMKESCHMYEWVVSHIYMSIRMSHMHESHSKRQQRTPRVTQQVWVSHITLVNESWHTYECVNKYMSVKYVNELCHTNSWVTLEQKRTPRVIQQEKGGNDMHDFVGLFWLILVSFEWYWCHLSDMGLFRVI